MLGSQTKSTQHHWSPLCDLGQVLNFPVLQLSQFLNGSRDNLPYSRTVVIIEIMYVYETMVPGTW